MSGLSKSLILNESFAYFAPSAVKKSCTAKHPNKKVDILKYVLNLEENSVDYVAIKKIQKR